MQRWLTFVLSAGVVLIFGLAFALAGQKPSGEKGGQRAKASGDKPDRFKGEAGGRALTPVIVELFTSEGCSSCPPADELLARLEKTQPVPGAEIIALGQHVDYWNQLGWPDPFSSHAFSERQGVYAGAFGRDGVYTPQMIVDGRAEFPGGNQTKARAAIADAAQTLKAMVHLALVQEPGGAQANAPVRLTVSVEKLPAVSSGDNAEVLLAITESNLRTNVPRGENGGRTLSHTAVVRQLAVIGAANSQNVAAFEGQPTVTLNRAWNRKRLRAVVFVQENGSRRVLGAASIKLASE